MFLDESGFMLQPIRRRTWAPRGQTPVQKAWDRHDRLSVISAITVSPQTRRLGLYFQIHHENIRAPHIVEFLTGLHRHLRRKSIVVWDRYSVHRKATRELLDRQKSWFDFEFLPGYAPELNPVEFVWNHTKYAQLANYIPEDLIDLKIEVDLALETECNNQTFLRSCFGFARLRL